MDYCIRVLLEGHMQRCRLVPCVRNSESASSGCADAARLQDAALTPAAAGAAGYVQRDYSVGVLLKDLGKVLTVSYAHNIDPTSSVGAEVTKKLEEKEATVFALGCAHHQVVL